MKVKYSPQFFQQYKKADVRIQSRVDEKIEIFLKDPMDLELDNHALEREWAGYRSIDITADYRAIFKEIHGEETIVYFVALGTHEELYKKNPTES